MRQLVGRSGVYVPTRSAVEDAHLQQGDVERLRSEVTMSAVKSAAVHLGGMRDGRKSLIVISEGLRGIQRDATRLMTDLDARRQRQQHGHLRDRPARPGAVSGFRRSGNRSPTKPAATTSGRTTWSRRSGKSSCSRAAFICSATRRTTVGSTAAFTRSRSA